MSSSRDDFGIAIRSALLKKGARQKFSLVFLLILAIIIFLLDIYQFKAINFTKIIINDGIYRLTNISTAPFKLLPKLNDKIKETAFAMKENEVLKAELENLKNKEFQVEFLKNQNDSLRKILESDVKIKGKSIIAKVLLDKDSPFLKSIVINRGSKSGINKGMPVVDGNYLVGKIVEVNYLSSRVLLLNDLNSRIPITFGEDSVQAILSGKGESKPVLEYLPELYEPYGNLTVFTSGKDGIFIPGIPVGKTEMDELDVKVNLFSDPNQLSFVTVQLINISKDNL